ncbi:hypothetical protein GC722_10880 [Auraticoccus sp. F435]|uniref:PPE domain-containing protein n=1 Tax=Auraticoccus cholistanensis TaxID=2656650 RepID=A0A6A9UXZ1_9ACTN|nr:hypothetical protein [Auraticoccus cholistanensis]MVA76524.1 hypothetical protein [Auraticoccus cholistanensis]
MGIPAIEVDFDPAAFEEACDKIRQGIDEAVDAVFPQLRPLIDVFFDAFLLPVPDFIRQAGYKVVEWAFEMLESLVNGLVDLFEGMLVPVTAFLRGRYWADQHEALSTHASNLQEAVDAVSVTWTGRGQRAFAVHAGEQVAQVEAAAELAKSMRTQCWATAAAGLTCYLGIAVAVVKFITVATASTASTPVTGPGGPAAAGAAAGVGFAEVAGVVTAVLAALGQNVSGYIALSDAADALAGGWPEPAGSSYSDGSASDGDGTDWSTGG